MKGTTPWLTFQYMQGVACFKLLWILLVSLLWGTACSSGGDKDPSSNNAASSTHSSTAPVSSASSSTALSQTSSVMTQSSSSVPVVETTKGMYERMCGYCHGDEVGELRSELGDALIKSRCNKAICGTRQSLADFIDAAMPFGLTESCKGECAQEIADYIFDNFAGFGDNPTVDLPNYLDKGGDTGACGQPNTGFTGLRRVGQLDYNNMVNDLFGLDGNFVTAFTGDEELGPFLINFKRTPSIAQVIAYFSAAEAVVKSALQNKVYWMPSCEVQNDNCAEQVISDIGRKAFRRPLSEAEKARLMTLFRSVRNSDGFDRGLQVLLEAILTSPRFLYYVEVGHVEVGQALGDVVGLTQYELAARMAFFLWRSLPDNVLLEAAESSELQTDDQIRSQAERMLNDRRARQAVRLFHTQWMQLREPELGSDGYAVEQAELEGFARTIETLVLGSDLNGDGQTDEAVSSVTNVWGSLGDLFSMSDAFLNADAQSLYNVSDAELIAQGHDGFNQYRLNDSRRAGLLARIAFLRSTEDALHRGLFIREELLCQVLPDPPPNAAGQPLPTVEGLNPRELFKLHTQDAGCAGCHILMDPLGYPLDNFDSRGQWRTTYGENFAIDASGNLLLTDVNGSFTGGGQELQSKLAQSQDVRACYIYKWFQFATGRVPANHDACSLGQINQRTYTDTSDGSIRTIMTNIILSDAFRYLRAAPTQ